MVWITRSLVAFGLFGAMAAATPMPTQAQGVHFEGRGFGVDVGRPYHDIIEATATTTLGIGVAATAGL